MPVLVAPADAPLGALIALRILREGGEVRAYCVGGDRGTAEPSRLRSAGAVVAQGDLDDEGRLEAAMAQAHSVVLLGPDVLAADEATTAAGADAVVRAAANAGVRRLIATSVTGAATDADDALRRAAARLEREVAAAPVPSVVVRLGWVEDPRTSSLLATLPRRVRERLADVPVAPLAPMDAAELVAAFDAARSTAHTGHVVFAAHGADRRPLGELIAGAGGTARPYVAPEAAPLALDALAGPWLEPDPAVFDAFSFTGVSPSHGQR